MAIVRAAGGLLWREGTSGPELAVVHRPRSDGWGLPKGKLDPAESWKEAAVREVREETGCDGRITLFAGATFYVARRHPKVVLYWHMALVHEGHLGGGGEIDEMAWLSPAAAIARLHHRSDRRLVARAVRRGIHPVPAALPAGSPRVAARAGVAIAAGLALGVTLGSPAKRRAFIAGGATGLVGAASVALAALAAGRRRQARP